VYYFMSEFAQTDLPDRILASALPLEKAVIVGSSTLEVLGIRRAQDIDAVVPTDVYQQLRTLHNLEEEISPESGFRHLVGDGLDISTGWNGKTAEQIREGGYTHRGIAFAGLPDVYDAKQQRGYDKDGPDLEAIRKKLYGDKPLPKEVLGKDLSFVQGIVPEHLRDHPAVHVAANGLYIVRTIFGHEGETVRNYNGSVETTEVPATYHAWEHSAFGARDGQDSMDNGDRAWQQQGRPGRCYGDNERLSGLAFTNHDAILGHGRRSANPETHDERQAAELVVRHLEGAGVSDEKLLDGSYQTVIVTTFNEQRKAQDIDPARGHLTEQQNGAAMDMSAMRRPDGPLSTIRLAVEDLTRVGAGYDKPLHRLVEQINASLPEGAQPVRISSTEDGLRLIQENPDFPVVRQTPNGPVQMTLREALATHVGGSGWFYDNYKFPENWQSGDPSQHIRNIETINGWSSGIKDGTILPTQLPALGKAYIEQVRAHQSGGATTAHETGAAHRKTTHGTGAQHRKTAEEATGTDPLMRAITDIRNTLG
jgi:NADH:ubiquinone oxidoreductase subunit